MGKADVNVNIWLSEKKRFANLFNGVIYGGRQVILPFLLCLFTVYAFLHRCILNSYRSWLL